MIDFQKENDDVFYTSSPLTLVDGETIDFLKKQARRNPRRRCRLCCHLHPSEPLHDMIIAMAGGAYVQPHRHLDKDETLHLIEGRGWLLIFEDDGIIRDIYPLGEAGKEGNFIYRMPVGTYHTQLNVSDWMIFHESASGPFDPEKMQQASWAPTEDDPAAGIYRKKLLDKIKAFEEARIPPSA